MTYGRIAVLLLALTTAACTVGGNMHITWDIVAPDDCIPGDHVVLQVAGYADEEYACTAYEAFTLDYPPGTYSVTITLYNANEIVEDELVTTVTIVGGATVSLPLALFEIP